MGPKSGERTSQANGSFTPEKVLIPRSSVCIWSECHPILVETKVKSKKNNKLINNDNTKKTKGNKCKMRSDTKLCHVT